jgi:hypothetical protein
LAFNALECDRLPWTVWLVRGRRYCLQEESNARAADDGVAARRQAVAELDALVGQDLWP